MNNSQIAKFVICSQDYICKTFRRERQGKASIMSEDGGPGRAVNRGESRSGSEQVPPELTKVSPALTTRSFPEATNDFLRCQIGRMVSKRHGPVFYQANDEHDPTERTIERGPGEATRRDIGNLASRLALCRVTSHRCKILATFPLQFP